MEQNQTAENTQAILKTRAFGGFDKKQVLAYIDGLRTQNNAAVVDLDRKIDEISAARSDLAQRVGSFERQMAELEQQLEQRGTRIRELTGEVDSLKGELHQNQIKHAETGKILSQEKEQNRQLALRVQSYEYKAKQYDSVATQLGEIVLKAKQDAQEVIESAKVSADEIKGDAIMATETAAKEMELLRNDLEYIRENIGTLMTSFTERLDAVDQTIDNMARRRRKGDEREFVADNEYAEPKTVIQTEESSGNFFRFAAEV